MTPYLITKKQLSLDQRNGLADMMTFMKDKSEREMVLTGAAGTGKTSLLNVFLKEVTKELHIKYYCTAYTNEAVRVLSQRSGKEYDKIICALLGLKLENNEDKGKILIRDSSGFAGKYKLIVIDEASMINDELLVMIHSVMAQYNELKLLYVGDEAQLPPVKYKSSAVFKSISHIYKLTKVMRVSDDNPILDIVTPIRENLLCPNDLFVREDKVNSLGNGVHFYTMKPNFFDNLLSDFKSDNYVENKNYCRLLAYTNEAVDASNGYIRRNIFGNDVDEYVPGDDLVVTEGYTVKLAGGADMQVYANGERLSVKAAVKTFDSENAIPSWDLLVDNYAANSKKRSERHVKVLSFAGRSAYIIAKNNLINTARMHCTQVDPISGGKMYTRREAWSNYYDFVNSFCYVNYTYAMTVHKAQGSTIDNVYVVENDINRLDWDIVERNKLKYTAFTRASKNLHIYFR
jgi:exodeoxyribonuclease-5